nr:MAG TPA: hypothetical protein [Caudoviricetes sp.]
MNIHFEHPPEHPLTKKTVFFNIKGRQRYKNRYLPLNTFLMAF